LITLDRLKEFFGPMELLEDNAFGLLDRGIRRVKTLNELQFWWSNNNQAVLGLPDELKTKIINLKDELKAKLK